MYQIAIQKDQEVQPGALLASMCYACYYYEQIASDVLDSELRNRYIVDQNQIAEVNCIEERVQYDFADNQWLIGNPDVLYVPGVFITPDEVKTVF